jgi:hypothetical protein
MSMSSATSRSLDFFVGGLKPGVAVDGRTRGPFRASVLNTGMTFFCAYSCVRQEATTVYRIQIDLMSLIELGERATQRGAYIGIDTDEYATEKTIKRHKTRRLGPAGIQGGYASGG